MRKIKITLLSIVFLAGVTFAFTPTDKFFAIAKNLDIFASLFKEVNALYVDEVDPELLIGAAIDAMLESLDPYTTYIPEEQVDNFRSLTTGSYAGVGAMIGKMDDRILITMPYASFAADKAGLKVGDEIISVDGIYVKNKSVSDVSNMLKGKPDTKVDVTVKRYGNDKFLTFSFKREKVKIKNVPYYGVLKENIGYIKLEDFTLGSGREVGDAVERLKLQGVERIVLDLRDNPGGLLNEAVNVVNVFIPKGKEVVETRGKIEEWNKTYKTLNNPTDTEIPLIVLINENSASASEIVAGAIQDYDRGILMGRNTFGKGLVQTTRPLSYNSQLKVTTAKYYTPSGRCIQSIDYSNKGLNGEGIEIPDSLRAAFKTRNGRIVYDGHGLQPDIPVTEKHNAAIIDVLKEKGFIFDYATEWYYTNPDKKKFNKSDDEFQKFKLWLADKKFSYNTEVEDLLVELQISAKNEAYFDELKDEISSLQSAIALDKKNDLEKFKFILLEILEKEIDGRIFLYEGAIKANFDDDVDILAAIKIFDKEDSLKRILTRN